MHHNNEIFDAPLILFPRILAETYTRAWLANAHHTLACMFVWDIFKYGHFAYLLGKLINESKKTPSQPWGGRSAYLEPLQAHFWVAHTETKSIEHDLNLDENNRLFFN